MFRLSYAHIYKIETLTVSVVVASFFIISAFAIYLMVLGFSCLLKRFQKKKSYYYAPTVNFRNDIGIADEDSVYFSEVSPSADSLSRHGSLISTFTSSSTASTLSDENTKSWLPATLNYKKMGCKQKHEAPPTSVCLNLKFVPCDEETNQHGKLHISIKNIVSLPTKDYPRYTEAYVKLQVIRVQRTLKAGRTESKIYEFKTRTFRNTRGIEMEEHCVVEAERNDIKNLHVNVIAYDQDIYTKPTELASATIPLSQKFKEICSKSEGVELISHLKHAPKNEGNLLVGLSYLPTSQRLSVNIVKAANLPNVNERNAHLYAQLFLLTGVTGRSLKRKKLQFNISENDPFELNGTLSFDVTPSQLENVTLLIILYMKKSHDKPFQTISMADADFETRQDHCFGSVAIGKLVKNHKGKKHWRMMTMAPRRVVTVWHTLK